MKKIFLVLLFLVFFSTNFLPNVYAEDPIVSTIEPATSTAQVDYQLPYPGVLPDNPLYFLKAIRDRLVSLLINDPVKRAEFNLLTSDKRVYASEMLADRNKDDLSVSTFSKSNNYLDESIVAVGMAKKMGSNYDGVLNNLDVAIKGHQKTLIMIKQEVDKRLQGQLDREEKRLEKSQKSVSQLIRDK